MNQSVLRLLALITFVVATSIATFAQGGGATASLSGTVKDPNGAVVVGATVEVKSQSTGQAFTATTTDNGAFTVPAVSAGKYTVTIKAQGFKTAVVKDVEVLVATPASVEVALQVGAQNEEIQVTGAGEVLQTQSATVSNTITGRQITDLPFASRNALDLVLFLPGVSSPARPRQSTINGLPKGALNITLDGVNIQDNLLKSSDGFFTYIQPKTDAIEEVTVSTATPGAESSGEGGAQIKFITRGGTNSFNGSVYEYHRNPALNANYYFNNLQGLPRTRVILNQFGGRVGGPIIKDRAFFFVNYEEYRLPEAVARTKTILSTNAQNGLYTYTVASGAAAGTHTINLLQLAANNGQTSTLDPTTSGLLAQVRSSTSQGTVSALADANLNQFNFINTDTQIRKFPTVRFDFQLTSKHHLENIYNYQNFNASLDILNNLDPAFPGFPNQGGQGSSRWSDSMALRSTITSNLVNEARFAVVGGTSRFGQGITAAQFNNQGGFALGLNAAGLGISSINVSSTPQKRNSPVKQFDDNITWTRGNHSYNFGTSFTQVNYFSSQPVGGVVSPVAFGVSTADPANGLFTNDPLTGNLPGASTAQLAQAAALYAVLTGRITSVGGTAVLDEATNKYINQGAFVDRLHQRALGFFAQDSWRFRPNLTLTGGLRYEIQFPFVAENNDYAQTTYEGLFGVSGLGNLFKPGTLTGTQTTFTGFKAGDKAFNTQYGNVAPSIGFAWSPDFKEGWLRKFAGESGQTVIRGGYSMAFVREGTAVVPSILNGNPGGTLNTTVSTALGNLDTSNGVLLRNGVPALVTPPGSPQFPIVGGLGDAANAFLPDLKTGRVHSWTFGIQRELNKDTVVEFRYVGNRAMDLWRQYSINETDVLTNGFINEFNLAEQNLIANNAAGGARASSFAYFGPGTGTSPLPTIFGLFQGVNTSQANNPALYTSTLFKNATFRNTLNPALPSALTFANTILANPGLFLANQASSGIPANFFVVNPGVSSNAIGGGSFLVDNSNRSYYDAMVIELRRRLSKGLLVQGSYTFAKGMTNFFASSQVVAANFTSLHNLGLNHVPSPFDITHALKANFIYELPFGNGHRFLDSSSGAVNRLVGGWSINGTVRIQSGTPFSLGNVQLVGMTRQELQDAIAVRHGVAVNPTTLQPILNAQGQTTPVVYYLPQDIITNTVNAFNGNFAPTGRYIAPANMNAAVPFTGAVGIPNLVLYGPRFTRFDLSFVKRTKITERVNFEFRAEFLNAFNNIDFRTTSASNDVGTVGGLNSNTFGQTTFAYQDLSTTNDPGGRLIQFVARINF